MERGGYGRRRVLKRASWNRKTRGGRGELDTKRKKRQRAGESEREQKRSETILRETRRQDSAYCSGKREKAHKEG